MQDGAGNEIGAFYEGDGTGVQTLYQGDGTVLWSGDGDAVILQPQSDDLAHFNGDTDGFVINNDAPLFRGALSLKSIADVNPVIGSSSGLDEYPQTGNPHWIAYYPTTSRSGANLRWAHSSETQQADGYDITTDLEDDLFRLNRRDGGSSVLIDEETTVSWSAGHWYLFYISHAADGALDVRLFDAGGSELATLSGSDSTYITNGSYDNQGIIFRDFRADSANDSFWDYWVEPADGGLTVDHAIHNNIDRLYRQTIEPAAYHHNGKTYVIGLQGDAHVITAYDESAREWGEVYEIDSTVADRHHTGAMFSDSNDLLHVIYGSIHGTDEDEFKHAVSANSDDETSWDTTATNISERLSYRQIFSSGDDVLIFTRKTLESGIQPLHLVHSSDAGGSWAGTELVSLSDRRMYPSAIRDGDEYHLCVTARGQTSGDGEEVIYLVWDDQNDQLVYPNGQTATPPITSTSDLQNNNAIVDDSSPIWGQAVAYDGEKPAVAWSSGSNPVTIEFSVYDEETGQWEQTEVAADVSGDMFAGDRLRLVADSTDNWTIYETTEMATGDHKQLGRYVSTDNGGSWSNREAVQIYPETQNGIRHISPVRNAGPTIKWVGSENHLDANQNEGSMRVFGLDGNFRIVDRTVFEQS